MATLNYELSNSHLQVYGKCTPEQMDAAKRVQVIPERLTQNEFGFIALRATFGDNVMTLVTSFYKEQGDDVADRVVFSVYEWEGDPGAGEGMWSLTHREVLSKVALALPTPTAKPQLTQEQKVKGVWSVLDGNYAAEMSELEAISDKGKLVTPFGNLTGNDLQAHKSEGNEITHWTASKFGYNFIIFND